MINLRVDDLDAVLAPFRAAGEDIITKAEWDDPQVGRFARRDRAAAQAGEISLSGLDKSCEVA